MSLFTSAPSPHRPRQRSSNAFPWCAPSRPGIAVIALAVALLLATAGVLALDRLHFFGNDLNTVQQFERMAGGLGLGATVCPRWCFVNFDPRIERCTCGEEPLPGGYCYCPEHTGTVSFFAVCPTRPRAAAGGDAAEQNQASTP
jgi:hypothetical protein